MPQAADPDHHADALRVEEISRIRGMHHDRCKSMFRSLSPGTVTACCDWPPGTPIPSPSAVPQPVHGRASTVSSAATNSALRLGRIAEHVRGRAPGPELNLLIHAVSLDGTRKEVVRGLRRFDDTMTEDQLADVPTLLNGSPTRIAEELHRLRAESGISYITVPEPAMDTFAEVLSQLR